MTNLLTPFGTCIYHLLKSLGILFWGWGGYLIREGTITRQTFARWKRRGWIDEDMRNVFMTYCFGNRWRK